jgi:hypothetical protein
MLKTAAPAGAGTAARKSVQLAQHGPNQFEGKEKASSQSNANQSEKLTICHEASPPFIS